MGQFKRVDYHRDGQRVSRKKGEHHMEREKLWNFTQLSEKQIELAYGE